MNLRVLSSAAMAAQLSWGAPAAQENVAFEDPSSKGSLIEYDYKRIPRRFRGLWADQLQNCHTMADRGVQVRISKFTIGSRHVLKVEGYSDHPAIVVTVVNDMRRPERLDLDISTDNQYIRLKPDSADEMSLLRRCPIKQDAPRPKNAAKQPGR
jgi:hypothetical protein